MFVYHLSAHTVLFWEVLKGLLVVRERNEINFCSLWMSVDSGGVIDYMAVVPVVGHIRILI